MRYLVGLVCVLALGVMPLAGCSDSEGTGGSGGEAGSGGAGGSEPPSQFSAEAPVEVTTSGESPFAECDAATAFPESETETWIEVNPTNPDNIVGVWMQGAPVFRGVVAGVSFNAGESWESVVIPKVSICSGGEFEVGADPWLAFALNGDLYSLTLSWPVPGDDGRTALLANKSLDGGLTWSEPVLVDDAEPPQIIDKSSITADPRNECNLYAGWTVFEGLLQSSFVSRTTDCGESWSEPTRLFLGPGGGVQIVVAPDESVLAFFGNGEKILVQRSTDDGVTWSNDPVTVAEREYEAPTPPDGDTHIRSAGRLFDVAIDRKTGSLYVVWEQLFAGTVQVALTHSEDGAATWSTPVRVDQVPSSESALLEQAFLPQVEVSSDGTIGVTYTSFENDTLGDARADSDYWFVHCHPKLGDCTEAASWSESVRLTPTSFDYLAASYQGPPVKTGLFLGDYFGLTSSGSDFFSFVSVTAEEDPADVIFVPVRGE